MTYSKVGGFWQQPSSRRRNSFQLEPFRFGSTLSRVFGFWRFGEKSRGCKQLVQNTFALHRTRGACILPFKLGKWVSASPPLYVCGFSGRRPTAQNHAGKVSRWDCEPVLGSVSPWLFSYWAGLRPVSFCFTRHTVGHLVSEQPWCQAALMLSALTLCHRERVSLRVKGGTPLLSRFAPQRTKWKDSFHMVRVWETPVFAFRNPEKKRKVGLMAFAAKVFHGVSSSLTAVEKMVLAMW